MSEERHSHAAWDADIAAAREEVQPAVERAKARVKDRAALHQVLYEINCELRGEIYGPPGRDQADAEAARIGIGYQRSLFG